MHRGTSLEQDARFNRAKKKRANQNVPTIFRQKLVNLGRGILWDSIDRWVELRTTALLEGVEDEILVGYIHERVTCPEVCPIDLAADLEGFLGDKALGFVEELWRLLVDASSNPAGVPRSFMSSYSKGDRRREPDSRRRSGDACRVLGIGERSNFEQLNLSGFKHTHSHADLAQLIRRNGYAVEEHFAETSDGYVLGLHRLPSSKADGGTPVVLQHGLLDSAATWVVNDAKHSLGFILADHGYDVWLASSRGSTFARNHTGWSTESTQFWDFTLDDMAAYDLPCTIEYVRRHTNGQAVALVAHSQGAALSLASLASGAIPPGHVKLLITLAPAVFLKYIDSVPLQFLASVHADTLFKSVGRREFLPTDLKTADLFGLFCTTAPQQCVSILTAICGFNPSNVDASRLPVYLAWAPSGTSVKNMAHWAQRVRDAQVGFTFRKYDYGRICSIAGARVACNQHMYGHLQPPSYDLSAISKRSDDVKIAVFYGTEDILADPVDVRTVVSSLGDVAVYEKGLVGYTHLDFTWSLSAADEVYQDVLGLLTSY